MSRFLFVVPPLVGHLTPTVAVAAELSAAGHTVAWAGVGRLVRALAGPGAEVHECAVGEPAERGDLVGPAALQFLWEGFLVPLARAMAPGVEQAVARFRPDVVVADQQALAGALVAERAGVPWVTSASTSTELSDPLEGMPKVKEWVAGLLGQLRAEFGAPAAAADPRFSPHGVLAFTTAELSGPPAVGAGPLWMVGPAMPPEAPGRAETDFPWEFLDSDARNLLVTMGTVNGETGAGFLRRAADAVGERPDTFRAVLVDPEGQVDQAPPNVLVRPFVPQKALLPAMDAVLCHAGHNTVCEALWHGLPLVVAPVRDDQPVVAQQVVDAGAGVRLRFRRATGAQVLTALDTVLDPAAGHQAAAVRIGRAFRAAGGAAAAARVLAGVAAG